MKYELCWLEQGQTESQTKMFQSLYAAAEHISNLHWWGKRVVWVTIYAKP